MVLAMKFSAQLSAAQDSLFPMPWGNYLLKELVEPELPAMVNWWPQTAGWKVVFVIVLIWSIKKAFDTYRRYRLNQYRRDALQRLVIIERDGQQTLDRQLPELLKWTAVHGFERAQAAGLFGSEWERWLDQQCDKSDIAQHCSGLLARLSYAPDAKLTPSERVQLFAQARIWIKGHRGRYD